MFVDGKPGSTFDERLAPANPMTAGDLIIDKTKSNKTLLGDQDSIPRQQATEAAGDHHERLAI